ncbi:hypothetical protein DID96_16400 [Burkholderia sp. Bp8963]|uniref:hypothetical protein n=1 Tax=Burkholderia sp. Bp8963 TaxID=2184547 RepID=UPI000F58FDE9|nr:hypothetical protein [Burkholderia sp. Bp8963]RQS69797.1 hypothetical protein DID96_16400 [Burkholderia sp. Bp8963]
MKHLIASSLVAALAAMSAHAAADTSTGNDTPAQSCAIAYVTGVGGSAQSLREYLASANQYRYLADNEIHCQISGEGRATGCVGVTNLRHERVSVYDDSDPTTLSVVARVELDRGTYPVIIVVPRKNVQCVQ